METEKVVSGLNWWAEAIISRRAQFSNVIVFRTLDPKRVEQFMQYLMQDKNMRFTSFLCGEGCIR